MDTVAPVTEEELKIYKVRTTYFAVMQSFPYYKIYMTIGCCWYSINGVVPLEAASNKLAARANSIDSFI